MSDTLHPFRPRTWEEKWELIRPPAQAAKTLKELHENQVIAGKAAGRSRSIHITSSQLTGMAFSGKQLVYHAVQDPADAMSLDELAAMDRELGTLRDSIATSRAKEKLLRANLISVNATLSTDELRSSVILHEHEKKEILGRLGLLRSGKMKPVLPEEKEAVDREWLQWSKKAGVRKKICLELWEFCTEEVPEGKTKEELWVCIIL